MPGKRGRGHCFAREEGKLGHCFAQEEGLRSPFCPEEGSKVTVLPGGRGQGHCFASEEGA